MVAIKELSRISVCLAISVGTLLLQSGCGKKAPDGDLDTGTRDAGVDAATPAPEATDGTSTTESSQKATITDDSDITGETDQMSDAGLPDTLARYGMLRTIAGACGISEKEVNGWQAIFEGGPALEAELSRPHFAMADNSGRIFIADKDAHAIRMIDTSQNIFTVAGTGEPGDDGDTPGPGTERKLRSPNGLWVFGDGTVFILDLGNSKVRRLDPSGEMTTLFTSPERMSIGRGLYVREDEALVYYANHNSVKRWTPAGGVETYVDGFFDLGNLVVDPDGALVAADRGGNRVYRIDEAGNKVAIAGNGETTGGGSGMRALDTALNGVRAVWFLDDGGYFLGTHEGSQVWFVDTEGIIHLFLDGMHDAHGGDGEPWNTPGYKISEARGLSLDPSGNLILTEHDCGYIRVVERI